MDQLDLKGVARACYPGVITWEHAPDEKDISYHDRLVILDNADTLEIR